MLPTIKDATDHQRCYRPSVYAFQIRIDDRLKKRTQLVGPTSRSYHSDYKLAANTDVSAQCTTLILLFKHQLYLSQVATSCVRGRTDQFDHSH